MGPLDQWSQKSLKIELFEISRILGIEGTAKMETVSSRSGSVIKDSLIFPDWYAWPSNIRMSTYVWRNYNVPLIE